MDDKTRREIEAQLESLRATNYEFIARIMIPPIPAFALGLPAPVPMEGTLNIYLDALRRHGEDFNRLITIVETILNDGE